MIMNFYLIYIFHRFAFVIFESQSDCADALKAHTKIGGEKVNISYSFAKAENQQAKPTATADSKKTINDSPNKKQPAKTDSPKKNQSTQPGW